MEALPRIVLTGASGFLGRHFLNLIRSRFRVFALARRSREEAGVPRHPNISWHQVDIADREDLERLFRGIRATGGAEYFVHLAAYYDFTGEADPEYQRSNVYGMQNVLELARILDLRHFVFASSLAACPYPRSGERVTESTPPHGNHVYSITKRRGEEMISDGDPPFKSIIVRFAALFSDWAEYAPLYAFLDTWLSERWNARILGGQGLSAIPYLHVRDAAVFLLTALERTESLRPAEVLLASPNGAVSHCELFETATSCRLGSPGTPRLIPKPLCRPAMWSRDLLGRLLGKRPFERPWMARYIDERLEVDASHTHARLNWKPRPRLEILRRLPFLIENFEAAPSDWHRRNRDSMKLLRDRTNLRVYRLFDQSLPAISGALEAALPKLQASGRTASRRGKEEPPWSQLIPKSLLESIRTRQKGVLMACCRDLAEYSHELGREAEDVCSFVGTLDSVCLRLMREDSEIAELGPSVRGRVSMTIRYAMDQVLETYDLMGSGSDERSTISLERQFWRGRQE